MALRSWRRQRGVVASVGNAPGSMLFPTTGNYLSETLPLLSELGFLGLRRFRKLRHEIGVYLPIIVDGRRGLKSGGRTSHLFLSEAYGLTGGRGFRYTRGIVERCPSGLRTSS